MATKIQITISKDAEHGGTDAGMLEAYRKLVALGVLPTRSIVMTIECQDQDAPSIRDAAAVALTDRPLGIEVKIKRTQEEDIDRGRMVAVTSVPVATPMEREWMNDGTSGSILEAAAEEWNRIHPESPATVRRAPRRAPAEQVAE